MLKITNIFKQTVLFIFQRNSTVFVRFTQHVLSQMIILKCHLIHQSFQLLSDSQSLYRVSYFTAVKYTNASLMVSDTFLRYVTLTVVAVKCRSTCVYSVMLQLIAWEASSDLLQMGRRVIVKSRVLLIQGVLQPRGGLGPIRAPRGGANRPLSQQTKRPSSRQSQLHRLHWTGIIAQAVYLQTSLMPILLTSILNSQR